VIFVPIYDEWLDCNTINQYLVKKALVIMFMPVKDGCRKSLDIPDRNFYVVLKRLFRNIVVRIIDDKFTINLY
jgi:meiotically up-regulated gene 157 (Mug157) protein